MSFSLAVSRAGGGRPVCKRRGKAGISKHKEGERLKKALSIFSRRRYFFLSGPSAELEHTLNMAMRANGTPSRAVDCARPYKLACLTVVPAAVEEADSPSWRISRKYERQRCFRRMMVAEEKLRVLGGHRERWCPILGSQYKPHGS
ncbi:hypothetical protein IMY05_004G0153100 [Salix suchowensis]|nr:hypothetical protein IMY05_004G0153100 [Salix suchowensis]